MVRPLMTVLDVFYSTMIEIVDFGYIQNNDITSLKMYITTEGIKSEKVLVRPWISIPDFIMTSLLYG